MWATLAAGALGLGPFLLAPSHTGPSAAARRAKPNVLFVTIDTLPADRLG